MVERPLLFSSHSSSADNPFTTDEAILERVAEHDDYYVNVCCHGNDHEAEVVGGAEGRPRTADGCHKETERGGGEEEEEEEEEEEKEGQRPFTSTSQLPQDSPVDTGRGA